jgi:hypothetical protein
LKDVSTSRVTSEEEAIFKAQQIDIIYTQFGMLYKILPDAPRSNYDPRKNLGPHGDGVSRFERMVGGPILSLLSYHD